MRCSEGEKIVHGRVGVDRVREVTVKLPFRTPKSSAVRSVRPENDLPPSLGMMEGCRRHADGTPARSASGTGCGFRLDHRRWAVLRIRPPSKPYAPLRSALTMTRIAAGSVYGRRCAKQALVEVWPGPLPSSAEVSSSFNARRSARSINPVFGFFMSPSTKEHTPVIAAVRCHFRTAAAMAMELLERRTRGAVLPRPS